MDKKYKLPNIPSFQMLYNVCQGGPVRIRTAVVQYLQCCNNNLLFYDGTFSMDKGRRGKKNKTFFSNFLNTIVINMHSILALPKGSSVVQHAIVVKCFELQVDQALEFGDV